ncbi:MAG: GDP-mannose 4,6-dehydratase [Bacteroidia bacterium]
MNVLITGCAGFIGSHVSEYFLKKGHKVIGIDNFDSFYSKEEKEKNLSISLNDSNFTFFELDIRNYDELANLPAQIDIVIHLAAKAGVRPSILDPQAYTDTNIKGTLNILEWMKLNKITKMIFGSSSSVYGNNRKVPFSENDIVDFPISPYAFTKKACELLNYSYHHLYGFDILNLRFFTVYGPRQRPDLAIRKFIELISNDKPIHLFGDGSTARDYTYIDDIRNGIFNSCEYLLSGKNIFEVINLGNNTLVRLNELVNCIADILGKNPLIKYELMQPGDVDVTFADIGKAKSILNYNPSTSLRTGIANFINWVQTEHS